jgi:hypothetical protein
MSPWGNRRVRVVPPRPAGAFYKTNQDIRNHDVPRDNRRAPRVTSATPAGAEFETNQCTFSIDKEISIMARATGSAFRVGQLDADQLRCDEADRVTELEQATAVKESARAALTVHNVEYEALFARVDQAFGIAKSCHVPRIAQSYERRFAEWLLNQDPSADLPANSDQDAHLYPDELRFRSSDRVPLRKRDVLYRNVANAERAEISALQRLRAVQQMRSEVEAESLRARRV